MTNMTPIERYLGFEATRGPVELLGLHSPDCTHEQVISALRTRLSRVARHPLGRSVEADEVRLALHAAAAQLMDPRVRAHLLEQPARRPQIEPENKSEEAHQERSAPSLPARDLEIFRLNAMALLRRSGGWNRQSMQFVAGLAHASGIPITELSRALHHAPGARLASSDQGGSVVTPASRARPTTSRRNDPTLALVGIIGGLGIALIVVMAVLTSVMPASEPIPDQQSQAPEQTTQRHRAIASDDEDGTSSLVVDSSNLLETLTHARDLLDDDPGEAAWRFERALAWYAPHWHTLAERFRFEVDSHIAEFLRDLAPTSGSWERAFESVAAPARELTGTIPDELDVTAAIWSVRFLQELRRETQTSTRLYDSSAALLGTVFEGRVPRSVGREQSLLDALEIVARRALSAPQLNSQSAGSLLAQWHTCVRQMDSSDARETLLVDAAGSVLRVEGGISSRRELRDASIAMLSDLSWGVRGDATASLAQRAMLDWMDDSRIATPELSIVTQWLSHGQHAPGVPSTYILSSGASESARVSVRERLAAYWSMGEIDTSSPRYIWRSMAASHLHARTPNDRTELVRDVVYAGVLLEAANALWVRRHQDASDALASLDRDLALPGPQAESVDGDNSWMVLYAQSANSAEGRMDAIRMVDDRQGPLSQGEADFLAEVALRGQPSQVRRRAQWIVRERRTQAQIVRGLLGALTQERLRDDAYELIEDLTGTDGFDRDDPQWSIAARRALVTRAIDTMAAQGPEGQSERYLERLNTSLRASASMSPASSEVPLGESILEASRVLRQQWEQQAMRFEPNPASRVSLDEIRQRRLGRARLVVGPIREFGVEQLGLVELISYVVIGERPDAVRRVERVLNELLRMRSASSSVLEQITLTQRALVELWWIRLGFPERESEGASTEVGGVS